MEVIFSYILWFIQRPYQQIQSSTMLHADHLIVYGLFRFPDYEKKEHGGRDRSAVITFSSMVPDPTFKFFSEVCICSAPVLHFSFDF